MFFSVYIGEGVNRPLDADSAESARVQLRESLVSAIQVDVVRAWGNPDAKRRLVRIAAPSPIMLGAVRQMLSALPVYQAVSMRRIHLVAFTAEELEADREWEDVILR